MKKKLVLPVIIICILFFISIDIVSFTNNNNNSTPLSTVQQDSFLIGSIDIGVNLNFYKQTDLGLNIWHKYTGWDTQIIGGKYMWIPRGWGDVYTSCSGDLLFADKANYENNVKGVIRNNYSNHYLSFLERPKIQYLVRAQRSDYQCEKIAFPNESQEWWYSYDSSFVGIEYTEGNIKGKYCRTNPGNKRICCEKRKG